MTRSLPPDDMGAYSVVFTPTASQVLARLRLTVRGQIRQRLNEIALVADSMASAVEVGDSPTNEGPSSTYALEVSGYILSYVVTDTARTLTVLSVARL